MENLPLHKKMMKRAFDLSLKARFIAPPNPWVGCVIAQGEKIVGEGYTDAPGSNHAEVNALTQAEEQAKGATAYVTLEPCSHYGKTPPCCKALIKSGIKKVFIALTDPDKNVCGNGIKALKANGIEVDEGIMKKEVKSSLYPYIHHRKTGLPYVIAKSAMSIDGKTAAADGSSKWITSEASRKNAHLIRAESQAIMVGTRTAIQDNPSLSVRYGIEVPKHPLRVLLDFNEKVPKESALFDTSTSPTLLFTSPGKYKNFTSNHLEIIEMKDSSLETILKILGSKGILQLLVEGGGKLQGAFFKKKLINQWIVYIGPKILGPKGTNCLNGDFPSSIDHALSGKILSSKVIGSNIRIDYLFNVNLK